LCSNLIKRKDIFSYKLSSTWEETAEKTYLFLKNHAVMNNHHIVYAVEQDGQKISDQMDISVFADCFYVLGMNAYALQQKDRHILDKALVIYQSIKQRIKTNEFKSEPYPIPDAFRSHSVPMILLNVSQELYETATFLEHDMQYELYHDVTCYFDDIMSQFTKHNRIVEMLPVHHQDEQSLITRNVNTGQILECILFMFHSLAHLGLDKDENYIEKLTNLAYYALNKGWDEKYGGLLRFVDKDGGKPKGEKTQDPFEHLIMDTWDTKLWWPHSEALYTTLLLEKKTGDSKLRSWYKKIEQYVFQTLPNKDKSIGEWVQIQDRDGKPSEKVVALPVKDPFHIVRNYLLIIDLLGDN